MLIDELQSQVKSLEPAIQTIQAFWQNARLEETFKELTEKTHKEDFWLHPNQASISQRLQHIRQLREQYQHILQTYTELPELLELFQHDEKELHKLQDELNSLCKDVNTFKVALLLQEQQDQSNCFVNINAGAGGTESQDWAHMLLRMFLRFCEQEKIRTEIVDYQAAEEAGIKSATVFIRGKFPYGLFKSEQGIHRLVRISPFDASKRRHTSFAAVTTIPETPDVEVVINSNELRIDTYRAGGAGGQHVNKTESAVRITHEPSGFVVQCQNERSQLKNKETAMKMLRAKLAQKQKEDKEAKAKPKEKRKIEWGSQIRSYVLHPYKLVKDHRTHHESPQPEQVLEGALMPFIEAYLVWKNTA